jgi:catechol 2,3-dioxygenase-like lactoylglutathione lyase family enzyme
MTSSADQQPAPAGTVSEVRLVLEVGDFEAALAFYRDRLGLPQQEAFESETGRVAILSGGIATIEIADAGQAAFIDQVEVGRRVAGPVRVALRVADSTGLGERLVAAGATLVGGPTLTPWRHRNVRLDPPEGVQLTLFTVE